jgi:hypothetical protein
MVINFIKTIIFLQKINLLLTFTKKSQHTSFQPVITALLTLVIMKVSLPECDAMQSGRNLLPSLHNVRRYVPDYTASYSRHPYSENQGVLVIRRGNSIEG